jgi:hypothetical protein
MRNQFYALLLTGLTGLLAGCNEDSYLEGVGPSGQNGSTTGGSSPGSTATGRMTIYCTNWKLGSGGACNTLNVYVDSQLKGTLTASVSSKPNCGTRSAGVLTLDLPVGSHSFSIYTSSSCLRYTFSETISNTTCLMQELN